MTIQDIYVCLLEIITMSNQFVCTENFRDYTCAITPWSILKLIKTVNNEVRFVMKTRTLKQIHILYSFLIY